jgi:hypothetical protein
MKIDPVGAELLHAGGQTDRYDEANNRFFCNSGNAPKTKHLTSIPEPAGVNESNCGL